MIQTLINLPRILVIRFSSIGDIVLTSPVVRCLHQQLGAEVHFLTKKSFKNILECNPYIDKIHTIKKDISEVLSELKSANFDYVVDLHKNLRTLQLRLALSKPFYSFNKLNFKKWLLVNLKIDKMPDVHIVDRYLAAVEKLGVKNDGQGLDYFIPKDTPEVDLSHFSTTELDNGYIAFAIGAAHTTKRMSEEKIVAICQAINRPIILLGGPSDSLAGEAISKKVGKKVYNLCGKISLHQSAKVVQNSSNVVSHDTGMMHIAAALKKDIVSVWGNTVPEFGMTPYYPKGQEKGTIVEVEGLACRPCSKIGHAKCPKGHFACMVNIDIKNLVDGL